MFVKKSFVEELENSMRDELVKTASDKLNLETKELSGAMDNIYVAAEVLDSYGFHKEAESLEEVLQVIAKKKSKGKDKKEKKSKDPALENLTSEKMIKNLEEKGWVFNANDMTVSLADDSCSADDHDKDDCGYCGDSAYTMDAPKVGRVDAVNFYSSQSKMEEVAEDLCEEYDYSVIDRSPSEITLKRSRDGYVRKLKFRPNKY